MKKLSVALPMFVGLVLGTAAQAADDQLKQINDRGALRVCLAESQPNGYKDARTGNWQGFNVDMAEALAKEMKVKLEYVDSSWSTIITSVQTNKCDVALVGLSRTAQRAQAILFVKPFNINTLTAVVPENSPIKSLKDLDNPKTTVAVISGSVEETTVAANYKATVKPMVTDKIATPFLEVASGRVDAMVTDTGSVRSFLKANPQMKLVELPNSQFAPRGTSYAVAPGQYQFQQFLDVWLEQMEASGMKNKLWVKWHPEASN